MNVHEPELTQIAALPFRSSGKGMIDVLLVTSRETGRWIIPKGWPMKGKKPHKAAAQEALEEAGVEGSIAKSPVGHYTYWKRKADHFVLCRVEVFALKVEKQLADWREKDQRQTRWVPYHEAADLVVEPALADLIKRLPEVL
jgi:8-oxo-dGTP pyrophosphatase MutT (NUDIX family)